MSALDILSYEDQPVRRLIVDGEPRIVVADIARILGYRDAANAARILREQHKGYSDVSTPSGVQRMLTTNAAGLNRLILRSNASNAEAVQDWVTDEVLTSIAETGSYGQPALTEDQIVQQALTILVAKTATLEAKVLELEPAAAAWDELAGAKGDYSVGDAAKMLARAGVVTGPQRLFEQLAELHWIFRRGNAWVPYSTIVDMGYLSSKPQSHENPKTFERVIDPAQVRVTVRGLERLRIKLGSVDLAMAS